MKDVVERRLTSGLGPALTSWLVSLQMLHIGGSNGSRVPNSPTAVKVATLERSSPADMPSSTPDGSTIQADRQLAISNSSNSSVCCMPSLVAQSALSYDIRASARTAELRHQGMASSEASRSHFSTAAAQHNQMPAVAQLQTRYPNHVLQSMMAHAFEDVDSGRHQHDELDSPQALSGPPVHHRRPISQQDSILPAYRSFFPSADPSSMPLQPQLFNHFHLPPEQLLPPELLDQPRPRPAQPSQLASLAQRDQQYRSHTSQEPGQSSNFPTFPALSDPVHDVLLQMSSDMRQWPSPAGSSARQGPAFTAAQHHMEGLEITGAIKRDHASFTGPTSHSRQAKPQSRRALSFTHASASSDTPLGAAASTGGGSGGGRRGENGSQAASGSRPSSPGSHAATPPETDASLSDSDDGSGSDTAGAHTKRRKVVKGKRGDAWQCHSCWPKMLTQMRPSSGMCLEEWLPIGEVQSTVHVLQ